MRVVDRIDKIIDALAPAHSGFVSRVELQYDQVTQRDGAGNVHNTTRDAAQIVITVDLDPSELRT